MTYLRSPFLYGLLGRPYRNPLLEADYRSLELRVAAQTVMTSKSDLWVGPNTLRVEGANELRSHLYGR